MMISRALQLSGCIQTSVLQLQQLCQESENAFHGLNDNTARSSERFYNVSGIAEIVDLIVAASSELIALVQPPSITVLQAACGHIQSAALRVSVESNIVELLRESSNGLHVKDISKRTGLPKGKIGRVLRYLAVHHIFREVEPNVYANNRVSTVMDSGKAFDKLKELSNHKHDGSKEQSFASLTEIFAGDLHKSSAYLLENLEDLRTGDSEEPNHAPFNRAFNVDVSLFEWYNQVEQHFKLRRFLTAMEGTDELQKIDGIQTALNWKALSAGSVIVDVGGGWGKATLPLAREERHLKYIIQDKAEAISAGQKIWESELGRKLTSQEVTFQAHDFFCEQPIKDATLFILKHILHTFSNPHAAKILRNLRDAASTTTRLLIIDTILPYACLPESNCLNDAGLAINLSHYAPATKVAYDSDLTMMLQLNSQERTLDEMTDLLLMSGWKVVEMQKAGEGRTLLQPLMAIPI